MLHVITSLGSGGTERQLHLLATRATRERSRVLGLRGDGPVGARLAAAGIPVRTIDLRAPSVRHALLLGAAGNGADVVHGWLYHGCVAALALARARRLPVVWSIRQELAPDDEKRTTAALVRAAARLSRHVGAIVYNSAHAASQHESAGFCATRASVIPNGFDLDAFRPVAGARERLRARLRLAPGAVLVGTLGRAHPMKDQATFLRAAAVVSRDHPDAHFAMFGSGVTAANRPLARLAAELGVGTRVHLGGETEDVAEVLSGLDVFVSPSRVEGMPNAVGEAMACAVACVATDAGDTARLLGDSSRIVPVAAPERLAGAIVAVLALDRAARTALGEVDRERVGRLFSVPAMVTAYEDLHHGLVAGRRCAV